jgi:autotransporter translocation and assembly factor TamB
VPVVSAVGRELELVTVRVRGTFSEPQLSFESETGYDEKTIIKLLAGIPVDSGAEQAQFQELALRMAGKELGRGLADAIQGIDTVQLEAAEPGGDRLTGTRIGVGKYMDVADKPLYLRYSQGLSISERDIFLEYQLQRRFLVTFEMRRRLRESVAHTSLNADLKFRVEY